jgi:tRNA G46 methylase TrmB
MSKRSKKRMAEQWPRYGVSKPPYGSSVDVPALFGNRAGLRVVLEVGFGGGDCLLELARRTGPQTVLMGLEWHRGSIAKTLQRAEDAGVTPDKLRVMSGDLGRFLRDASFPPGAFDEVVILFPGE